MRPFRFRAALLLPAALAFAACVVEPDPRPKCDIDMNGVVFINYDGVKADNTAFTVGAYTVSLGDTADGTGTYVSASDGEERHYGGVYGPYGEKDYYYSYSGPDDGFVTFELIKDDTTKSLATFEVTAQRGDSCAAGTTTLRKYSVVWLETVDGDGYTDVEVILEE